MRFLTIGIGHCGGKIASTFKSAAMNEKHLIMDVCGINTDKTDLASHDEIPAENKLLVGTGKGAAKDWKEGFHAGSEAKNNLYNMIRKLLKPETDIIMLALGEGGGTGSGMAPIIAEMIGDLGRECIITATLPFQMESVRTKINAAKGLDMLYREEAVKALILIDNDKIVAHYPDKVLTEAYQEVNKTTVNTFINLLKLANTPSQADRVDESELCSIFNYPGFATLANYRSYANMVSGLDSMLKHSWEGSLFADVEPNSAAGALLGVYGPSNMFTTTQVDKLRGTFKDMLVGKDAMLGVYPVDHCRWVSYVGIMTGLDIPLKVKELLDTAREEHHSHEQVIEERKAQKAMGLGFDLGTELTKPVKNPPQNSFLSKPNSRRKIDLESKASFAITSGRDISGSLKKTNSLIQGLRMQEISEYELVKKIQGRIDISEEEAAACIVHLKEVGSIIQPRTGMLKIL
jgi:cell division GTPase FtsZ